MIALPIGGSNIMLVHFRIDVTIGHHHIHETIQVKIDKLGTPTEVLPTDFSNARSKRDIREAAVPIVPIKRIVILRKIRHDQVQIPIVIIVAKIDAHAGLLPSVLAEGDSCLQSDLGKRLVSIVSKKEVGSGIIGDKQIQIAIIVIVTPHHPETIVFRRLGDPGLLGDIHELPISQVFVKPAGSGSQTARTTLHLKASKAADRAVHGEIIDIKLQVI